MSRAICKTYIDEGLLAELKRYHSLLHILGASGEERDVRNAREVYRQAATEAFEDLSLELGLSLQLPPWSLGDLAEFGIRLAKEARRRKLDDQPAIVAALEKWIAADDAFMFVLRPVNDRMEVAMRVRDGLPIPDYLATIEEGR